MREAPSFQTHGSFFILLVERERERGAGRGRGGGRGRETQMTRTPATPVPSLDSALNRYHDFSGLLDAYETWKIHYDLKENGMMSQLKYKEAVDGISYCRQKLDEGEGDVEEHKKLLEESNRDLKELKIWYDKYFFVPMEKIHKMRTHLAKKLQGIKHIHMECASGKHLENLLKEFGEFRPTKVRYRHRPESHPVSLEEMFDVCTSYKIEVEKVC